MNKHMQVKLISAAFVAIAMLVSSAVSQVSLQKLTSRSNFRPTRLGYGIPISKVEFPNAVDQGTLRCRTGRMGVLTNCVVRNMPLLHQTDPRLDEDVRDMGPLGCYDTSIATVILTALANRTSTRPLTGRTKEFAEVPASDTAPKEVEQLSWYYRTAKKAANNQLDLRGRPIQSLYLSEVVAGFGRVNENCNPFLFANCTSATNSFGHSYYEFSDGQNWTNDLIVKKLRDGYAVFIAYERFKPSIVVEKNRKVVKFVSSSIHKVVFSGFQLGGKYPLLINDVGNGKQYRVRLGTDLFQRKFALAGSSNGETMGETDFVYPLKTATFMEYEGTGTAVNDEVFFVVHMDAIKLN